MLTEVYVARLWLTCSSSDTAVLDEFDQRFTATLQRKWSILVYDAAIGDQGLCDRLTARIRDECVNSLGSPWPLVDMVIPNGTLNVFDPSRWQGGPGTTHEATELVRIQPPTGGSSNWKMPSAPMGQGIIRARCTHHKVMVLS